MFTTRYLQIRNNTQKTTVHVTVLSGKTKRCKNKEKKTLNHVQSGLFVNITVHTMSQRACRAHNMNGSRRRPPTSGCKMITSLGKVRKN